MMQNDDKLVVGEDIEAGDVAYVDSDGKVIGIGMDYAVAEKTMLVISDGFQQWVEEVLTPVVEKINEAIREWAEAVYGSINWDALYALGEQLRLFDAMQREDESFLEWSRRLQVSGYLDDPDIRWMYQKATFLWLMSPLLWVWRHFTPTPQPPPHSDGEGEGEFDE